MVFVWVSQALADCFWGAIGVMPWTLVMGGMVRTTWTLLLLLFVLWLNGSRVVIVP